MGNLWDFPERNTGGLHSQLRNFFPEVLLPVYCYQARLRTSLTNLQSSSVSVVFSSLLLDFLCLSILVPSHLNSDFWFFNPLKLRGEDDVVMAAEQGNLK